MARKLKTEIDTPKMSERVKAAFEAQQGRSGNAEFEHGQWWIIETSTGRSWSVVDAVGGASVDGFDFEEL